MKITQRLLKPSNWQDFEKLCLLLWRAEWNSDDLKLNGRPGQKQSGVDICGHRNNQPGFLGIQCKCKNQGEVLNSEEILAEVEKAKEFRPGLKHLLIATTAEKDAGVEQFIRETDERLRQDDLFSLDIKSWEDIVFLLELHKDVLNHYLDLTEEDYEVQVLFSDNRETLEGEVLYYRVPDAKYFHKMVQSIRDEYSYQGLYAKDKTLQITDLCFLEIPLVIANSGRSPLDDYKIKIRFDLDVQLSTNRTRVYSTSNPIRDVVPVFDISIQGNRVEYSSRFSLVPGDEDGLSSFYVKAPLGTTHLQLNWEFLSRHFHATGSLPIELREKITDFPDETSVKPQSEWEIVEGLSLKEY